MLRLVTQEQFECQVNHYTDIYLFIYFYYNTVKF
jgi:hypothetical protein